MVRDDACRTKDSPISISSRQVLAAHLDLPETAPFVRLWPKLERGGRAVHDNLLLTFGIALVCLPFLVNALWVLPRPNVYPPIAGYSYATQPRLASWDDPRLTRRNGEAALDFAGRITILVHKATYNCTLEEIGQSWWTALANRLGLFDAEQGLLSLQTFRCGFCHARAYIVAGALRNGGIADATALGLYGHVVATFTLDGKRYAADPDFGIYPFVLPEDTEAIRRAVERNYLPIVRTHGVLTVAAISDIYASTENNRLYSFEYLNKLRAAQDDILAWQRPIEIWCLSAGLSTVALHFLIRMLRGMRRKQSRAQSLARPT
jgi:hypothetical protein